MGSLRRGESTFGLYKAHEGVVEGYQDGLLGLNGALNIRFLFGASYRIERPNT